MRQPHRGARLDNAQTFIHHHHDDTMKPKTFADRLRAERERLNLSQAECAALLPPLSGRMIAKWEGGGGEPPEWVQPLIFEKLRRHKPRAGGSFNKPGNPGRD